MSFPGGPLHGSLASASTLLKHAKASKKASKKACKKLEEPLLDADFSFAPPPALLGASA